MNAPDRWQRVEALYHAARERNVEERAAFLDAACKDDVALRREVESLLAQSASNDGFLSEPAMAVAAPLIRNPAATVLIGRRIGAYQVQTLLGVGGMGEVYRARDTKLGRDVAIKILPRVFTSDPERLARFEREARVLASLNHTNIATIHGIEDLDGHRALVLELVEGETLAERIQRGALPIADALAVGRQIVDALDAAHERGIVHRDLKPANIKVTDEGVVKVLDFGLAKVASGDGAGPDLSHSPTVTIGGTREGMILGTAAYMSPEQARGKPVDKRADIWAFGCVLYEMLTGRAVFPRETVSDTIAAILERDPDWTALPAATPANARRLLHRCLEREPKTRLRDIGNARVEPDDRASSPREDFPLTRRRIAIGSALATGILLGAMGVYAIVRSRPATPAGGAIRFTFTAPDEAPQMSGWPVPSPDGRQIAFVAENAAGQKALWIRSIHRPLGELAAPKTRTTRSGRRMASSSASAPPRREG
jgi:eukaryotic-like serine/threonine-protein kinase